MWNKMLQVEAQGEIVMKEIQMISLAGSVTESRVQIEDDGAKDLKAINAKVDAIESKVDTMESKMDNMMDMMMKVMKSLEKN